MLMLVLVPVLMLVLLMPNPILTARRRLTPGGRLGVHLQRRD